MKELIHNNAGFIGVIAGFLTFIFWISIVGNPHVVETVLGLMLSLFVVLFLRYKIRAWTS